MKLNVDKQVGGIIYMADFARCKRLKKNPYVGEYFLNALKLAKTKVVAGTVMTHIFPNKGMSATAILKESHAAIHTWPEGGFVTFELFSCGESVDVEAAINYLADVLDCSKYDTNRLSRFPANAHITR